MHLSLISVLIYKQEDAPKPTPAASPDIFIDELLPDLIDEYQSTNGPQDRQAASTDKTYNGQLRPDELCQIRKDIAKTIRPGWQQGPPPNLGTKGHGKLKADQWRTCIEFDIPVSLVRLRASTRDVRQDEDREFEVVESTMLLATALRWATSHRTSRKHADEYMRNMRAYLASLLHLFPEMKLVPNHHNALYIGEMLLQFGPVHGWWMFPFERLIGLLQKINTNGKIGMNQDTT